MNRDSVKALVILVVVLAVAFGIPMVMHYAFGINFNGKY